MTKKELSQIYYIKRELADLEQRLMRIQAAAESTTQIISGLPFSKTGSDKTSLGAEIAYLKAEIESRKQKISEEYGRLTAYISSVNDSLIRQILTYRFIDGDSWKKVAYRVGGNNTEGSVKQLVYRFLYK